MRNEERKESRYKIKLNKKVSSFFLEREPTTWKREHYKTTPEQLIKYFGPKKENNEIQKSSFKIKRRSFNG